MKKKYMIKQYRICYLSTDFANACSFINNRVLGLYDIFSGSTLQRDAVLADGDISTLPHKKLKKFISRQVVVIPKKKIM